MEFYVALIAQFLLLPSARKAVELKVYGENDMGDKDGHHHNHDHSHDHGHDHSHDDGHDDGRSGLSDMTLRVKALESLLVEKGYVDPEALNVIIDTYENQVGPRNGAMVVAKAWAEPDFLDWLKRDATAAIQSLGFEGRQGEHMKVLVNDAEMHHMVVCTLCSCYPWSVLGLPPTWYKSAPYRAKAVIDPRGVLADFGVILPEEKNVQVWDSTAELRYLVIPERPVGTDGWDQERLADLVTRDSMIGTGLPSLAGEVAA